MKIATWNCNSVRARLERVGQWLQKHQPDVLCLQELKCTQEDFPREAFENMGYHCTVYGQKTYNGVAFLSKNMPQEVVMGMPDGVEDEQARVLSATWGDVRIVNVYAPNGQSLDSKAFTYKLQWYDRLLRFVQPQLLPESRGLLVGDFNIAPEDLDVYDPALWAGQVLCSEQEREAWKKLCALGLSDLFRTQHPLEQKFSWWDYRMLAFPKNLGLRIDHLLATRALSAQCTQVEIDREERKGKQPSDHAPVWAEFQLA